MHVLNAFASLLLAGLLAAPSSGTSIDWAQVDALLRDQVSSGAFPAAVAMIANADGKRIQLKRTRLLLWNRSDAKRRGRRRGNEIFFCFFRSPQPKMKQRAIVNVKRKTLRLRMAFEAAECEVLTNEKRNFVPIVSSSFLLSPSSSLSHVQTHNSVVHKHTLTSSFIVAVCFALDISSFCFLILSPPRTHPFLSTPRHTFLLFSQRPRFSLSLSRPQCKASFALVFPLSLSSISLSSQIHLSYLTRPPCLLLPLALSLSVIFNVNAFGKSSITSLRLC